MTEAEFDAREGWEPCRTWSASPRPRTCSACPANGSSSIETGIARDDAIPVAAAAGEEG